MIQVYRFGGETPLEFDDAKTVQELIQYAFEQFGYYEPFGMDAVTIYQTHHAHFTLDTSRKCSDEIKDSSEIYFAFHIPGFLYYAEGGWGHHMQELANHPIFRNPVSLKIKFEDFDHTVVFEGTHTFRDVLNLLKRVGYIETSISQIKIHVLAYPKSNYSYSLDCSNPILDDSLIEFQKALPLDGIVTLILGGTDYARRFI